ncbi:uncharacterized protein LOC108114787 [Drosophila eugracilis]|uniref:uncharacterized protein LOC108114787 n=1 Tax=Drosophila eugracilis TaxID=29029 RepID=UPI001BD9A951|nr:uncharacterized protein LOC108114787 [Drosophila eugracilis]
MTRLKLKLIGVVIFLVATLEAQESPVADSPATTENPGETTPGPAASTTGETEETTPITGDGAGSDVTGSPTDISSSTDTMDNSTIPIEGQNNTSNLENGGDPFVKPGKHRKGPRHVRAHDGFHNLRTEKYWAHWNDAFTKSGY